MRLLKLILVAQEQYLQLIQDLENNDANFRESVCQILLSLFREV